MSFLYRWWMNISQEPWDTISACWLHKVARGSLNIFVEPSVTASPLLSPSLSRPPLFHWKKSVWLPVEQRELGSHSHLSSRSRFSATFPVQLLNSFLPDLPIAELFICLFIYDVCPLGFRTSFRMLLLHLVYIEHAKKKWEKQTARLKGKRNHLANRKQRKIQKNLSLWVCAGEGNLFSARRRAV